MKIITACASLVLFSGCFIDRPSLGYGYDGYELVELGGHEFRIFTKVDSAQVEVHRVNFVVPPPSRSLILELAKQAIEQTSICVVKDGTLRGDQAIVKAILDCS